MDNVVEGAFPKKVRKRKIPGAPKHPHRQVLTDLESHQLRLIIKRSIREWARQNCRLYAHRYVAMTEIRRRIQAERSYTNNNIETAFKKMLADGEIQRHPQRPHWYRLPPSTPQAVNDR